MSATVYTTAGGRRFHFDRSCPALATGREDQAWRAGEQSWTNGASRWGLHRLRTRSNLGAHVLGYTACRVCVPARFALPATGETFGHEPVRGFLADRAGERLVCARCETAEVRSYWRDDAETVLRRWTCRSAVEWPCTSAVVLGLIPRTGVTR